MTQKPLEDDILMLRAIEVTDVDRVLAWENDSSQWDTTNTNAPFARKQLWDYAVNYENNIFATGNLRLMAIEKTSGNCIGCVDIFNFNHFHNRAEVGIYIDTNHRRRGFGSHAVGIALNYACNFLGLKQIVAEVAADNLASLNMLSNCGFTKCATLKCWFRRSDSYSDGILMQYLRK